DGRLRAPVADDGDDLADSRILAGGDQRLQERAPEALAGGRLAEVDGVLDGEAVSRLGRPRLGERVPEDLPRGRLGHQARQPGPGEPGELVAPEGETRLLLVEGDRRVGDVMVVDLADVGDVALLGRPDPERE